MLIKTKMRPLPKFLLIAICVAGLIYGIDYLTKSNFFPIKGKSSKNVSSQFKDEEVINVGVVTWLGYAGGQYFNGGFQASKESRYYKEYGILVNFQIIDDFVASRKAFISDKINVLWITADSYCTEEDALKEHSPKIFFQADWSRGGDVIVAMREIKSMNDLREKKVAVAYGTPSHTLLLTSLEAAGMTTADIKLIEVASAIDAVISFKAGAVDAAVVWSPDDADCVVNVPGAHILVNTKTASNVIADVFYAKEEYINNHRDQLTKFVEGWLRGAAEINSDPNAKKEAMKILAIGLNMSDDYISKCIDNARLCTYGDNINFFNLNGDYKGIKGEDLYNKMSTMYLKEGVIKENPSAWRTIIDLSILRNISSISNSDINIAEGMKDFSKATEEIIQSSAFSTKQLSVSFNTGSYTLDENAKTMIDIGFADLAKKFSNARIRIEGNTDIVGSLETNKLLSMKRAQAVANYLYTQYGFDKDRFIVIGNGQDKAIASNDTEEGRAKNRRTDFEILTSN